MQYGICGGPECADEAARAGFDFFEWNVTSLLRPREDESAFSEALEQAVSAALPCPVVNCFVPADLKITGPTADSVGLEQYAAAVFERAEKAQVELVVFGSGGARGIPDGFDREAARGQIVEFCSMIGPVARDYSVIVALEPLNRNECNVMNTVAECADIVRQVFFTRQSGFSLMRFTG